MAEEAKKSNKIFIIIIVVLILILLALGGIFLFLQSNSKGKEIQPDNINTTEEIKSGSTNYTTIGIVYQLDQFIVNLLSQSGRRYLKTTIGLEMNNPNLQNELDNKRGPIRDTINTILSSKSIDEISTARGKEKLKEEIVLRLNEFLVDGKIRNIFFLDFAIQ